MKGYFIEIRNHGYFDDRNKYGVCSDYCVRQLGLNDSDKVIVQIRKKEE